MAAPRTYQFNLPTAGRPDDVMLEETWYPGIRPYWEGASSRRIYDPILGVRAVVIHATAGASSDGAVSVIRDRKASFHWLVPDENEPQHGQLVWACIPEARAAWHVRNTCSHADVWGGATKVNHWSLGIEVVNTQQASDPFSAWQVEATARIVRYCWAKYPNLKHVVSHARLDPSRRSDPGTAFDWDRFRQLVLAGNGHDVPRALAASTRATPRGKRAKKAGTSDGGCCP
ncbi:N-acetylmuramoyl-L-alanine amidase [Lysobacter niastensis]|uniref:N-acetylmuramoyl-L-alanine amidase n=1 Tax=Lysobacter niastensis TaxID=380629 RepID=A0ABS0B3Y6_9GAMM|nr:N-acetylmuramoyl-L-alanine amidase [Lysobacter niastensis]MBF6023215.1 N-acetylmuramoyl-L-alanine amidase [Lysobacter niastensis]